MCVGVPVSAVCRVAQERKNRTFLN